MSNNVNYEFYPFLDKTRGNSVRLQVIIKTDKEVIKKTFTTTKSVDKKKCCQIANKIGIPFDIPVQNVKDIYNFIQEVESSLENGKSVSEILKPDFTVSEFAEKYFVNDFLDKQPNEKSRINKLLQYWKDYDIKKVNLINVEHFKNAFMKENAQSTVRKYCLILRTIFKLSVELGYRDTNPFTNVKLPNNIIEEETEPIPSALLPELFSQLKMKNQTLYDYCILIFYTGLRPVDILNLTFENVKQIDGVKVFQLRESKIKKYNRVTIIPVHPEIEKLIMRDRTDGNIFEFTSSRKSITHRMSDLFKTVTPDYVPYQLRHTFSTELSKADVNETHINFLLGKLPEGTMKHYLKRDIKTLYDAICKLPKVSSRLPRNEKTGVSDVSEMMA
ncbi:MAG TPA: hypothetical protein PKY81_09225 [bacterium]|nr:hypothetical protein [bacterium]